MCKSRSNNNNSRSGNKSADSWTNNCSGRYKRSTASEEGQSNRRIRASANGHLHGHEYAHAPNGRQGEAHHTPWHAQQTAVAAAGTDDTAAKSAMTVGAKALAK